jgi:hypothetical protein
MKKKRYHTIKNAYDAYWFIHDHPKLMIPERLAIETEKEALELKAAGYWVEQDAGGNWWKFYRHLYRRAIESNLDIFYTKTNKPGGHGRVDDDRSKNKHIECWLEFGPEMYGYAQEEFEAKEDHMRSYLQPCHDWRLDTGGSTFDQGLVNLARNVRKFYGDYSPRTRKDACGKPVCGDCRGTKKWMKAQGLE